MLPCPSRLPRVAQIQEGGEVTSGPDGRRSPWGHRGKDLPLSYFLSPCLTCCPQNAREKGVLRKAAPVGAAPTRILWGHSVWDNLVQPRLEESTQRERKGASVPWPQSCPWVVTGTWLHGRVHAGGRGWWQAVEGGGGRSRAVVGSRGWRSL